VEHANVRDAGSFDQLVQDTDQPDQPSDQPGKLRRIDFTRLSQSAKLSVTTELAERTKHHLNRMKPTP
jgi:hypothetical protein